MNPYLIDGVFFSGVDPEAMGSPKSYARPLNTMESDPPP
jgi:hypothetical protein